MNTNSNTYEARLSRIHTIRQVTNRLTDHNDDGVCAYFAYTWHAEDGRVTLARLLLLEDFDSMHEDGSVSILAIFGAQTSVAELMSSDRAYMDTLATEVDEALAHGCVVHPRIA